MKNHPSLAVGAISLLCAIGIGAFGAHALKPSLVAAGTLDTFQTGSAYHFYLSFAMILNGILYFLQPSAWLNRAFYCFLISLLFFSFNLYLLAITGIKWLGALAPIGGSAFMLGALCMAIPFFKADTKKA